MDAEKKLEENNTNMLCAILILEVARPKLQLFKKDQIALNNSKLCNILYNLNLRSHPK